MVTIKDVARRAGVSITTVSRALNGYPDVSPDTRRRVLQVAREMGYRANAIARSLVTKKTRTLGVLISGLRRDGSADGFVLELLCGMNDAAADQDYELILFHTNPSRQRRKSYRDLCHERQVDGVIVMGLRLDDPYLREVLEAEIPCVFIDVALEGENVGYVTSANAEGARRAIDHLAGQGHRHIAFVNGHDRADVSRHRLAGVRRACAEWGIPLPAQRVLDGGFEEEQARRVVADLLQRDREVTAVFCASDRMAIGAIRAAREAGRRVPEDLSVVGFDDIVLAQYVTPPLTTIRQQIYEMGAAATRLLIGILEGTAEERRVVLDVELVERASVAPPRT
ncbi:MAG: LacI family transcriptional regulator [Symbiobacteriaceae bacterium]|nr:MAG: LacI family transcriptional regulator [Bacillota bacterium]